MRPAGKGAKFVYVLRKGRVACTGVAAKSLKRPRALRRHIALSGLG